MNGTLAVAARELKEKWTVLVAALVAGLAALAVPVLSSLGRHDAHEARELAALILAAAFACAVAVVTGGGMITRELVERRHSFLFSRPLSASAIWVGKVLAAWLLAVGSGVAALLPAAALSGGVHLLGLVSPWGDAAGALGVAAVTLVALVAISHAVAVMVRSRVSWLLALDVIVVLSLAAVVALALRSLLAVHALDALTIAGVMGGIALLGAPLAAGLAQVSLGRTDIRRGHRALSATLWGALGVAAVVVAGYAHWVLAATPGDIVAVGFVTPAPSGSWIALDGARVLARGDYYPRFLYDTATGRSVRFGAGNSWAGSLTFSGDGRLAAWLAGTDPGPDSPLQVVTLDLAAAGVEPAATTIVLGPNSGRDLTLSHDGRRLAVFHRDGVEAFDLPSGRLLSSARIPAAASVRVYFAAGGDVLRVLSRAVPRADGNQGWRTPSEVTIRELDLGSRVFTVTGAIANVTGTSFYSMGLDEAHDRSVVTTREGAVEVTTLREGRTGAVVASLTSLPAERTRTLLLADGGVVVGEFGETGARLQAFAASGAPSASLSLGRGRRVRLAGEVAPGRVVVQVGREPDTPLTATAAVVFDVARGTTTPLPHGYAPVALGSWYRLRAEPGSLGTRLFRTRDGGLAVLDADTGAFRTVLAGRATSE